MDLFLKFMNDLDKSTGNHTLCEAILAGYKTIIESEDADGLDDMSVDQYDFDYTDETGWVEISLPTSITKGNPDLEQLSLVFNMTLNPSWTHTDGTRIDGSWYEEPGYYVEDVDIESNLEMISDLGKEISVEELLERTGISEDVFDVLVEKADSLAVDTAYKYVDNDKFIPKSDGPEN